jgi:hypothetical protein
MGKQFPKVSARYGAPMGRSESPLGEAPRSVRVFRVRINSGGYDDGGAYWGLGKPLFCAVCDEGGRRFVRADGRLSAIADLQIPAFTLKSRAGYRRLRELEARGNLGAGGVILRQRLQDLGF